MSVSTSFEHKPIGGPTCIRILLVAPGEPDDDIYCWTISSDLDADHSLFPSNPEPVESLTTAKLEVDGVEKTFEWPNDVYSDNSNSVTHPFQRYIALSYVWGSREDLQTIFVDSQSFMVTKNLDAALRNLRRTNRGLKVWIDAICINQNDPQEKKMQIGLMRRIYRQAKFVHAQVMSSVEHAENLRDLQLSLLMAQKKYSQAVEERKRRDSAAVIGNDEADKDDLTKTLNSDAENRVLRLGDMSLEDYGLPEEDSPLWDSWRHLFASPYFGRIWIVQEFSLAKEIGLSFGRHHRHNADIIRMCMEIVRTSSGRINASYMGRGSEDFTRRAWSGFNCASHMFEERDQFHVQYETLGRSGCELSRKQARLIDHLKDIDIYSATDERDKIFALLGLASDGDQFQSLVDYTRPWPKIFEDFARRFIETGDGVELLYQACQLEAQDGQPTWIPNWAAGPESYETAKPIAMHDFTAGGLGSPDIRTIAGKPQAIIGGFMVGTIVATSLVFNPQELATRWDYPDPDMIKKGYMGLSHSIISEGLAFVSGHNVKESIIALFETLIQATRDRGEEYYRHKAGFISFVCRVLNPPDNIAPPAEWSTLGELVQVTKLEADELFKLPPGLDGPRHGPKPLFFEFLRDAIFRIGYSRRLCVTDGGRLGLVPFRAEVGDKVFVMRGGGVPMILRKSDKPVGGGGAYELVGDAYVRGVMYGEGLADAADAEDVVIV